MHEVKVHLSDKILRSLYGDVQGPEDLYTQRFTSLVWPMLGKEPEDDYFWEDIEITV
jgi:hypothetical protein